MKNFKKIVSLLLSVCMLATMLTSVVTAVGGPNVSFSGVPSEVKVGDEIQVAISHSAANLAAAGLYLEFDSTKLECVSAKAANGSDDFVMNYNGSKEASATVAEINAGIFSFGVLFGVNSVEVASQTVAVLTFKAIATGEAAFSLTEESSGTDKFSGVAQTATLNIKEADKDAHASIAGAPTTVTYGDAAFTLAASATNTGNGGVWTWTSSNPSVLAVSDAGVVTVVGAGTATITATYVSDTTAGSATVTITVNKAELTITAHDQQIFVGETAPVLGANDYTVTGLVGNDTLVSGPTFAYDSLDTNKAGTYAIIVSGAVASPNYTITYVNGTLTVVDDPSVVLKRLSFETNGGSAIDVVIRVSGTVVDLSGFVSVKAGCKLVGWYADKALTKKVTSVTLNDNMTVYAKWESSVCDGGANCPAHKFADVDSSMWYHEAIDFVVTNGMMNGVADDRFAPHGVITRAMFVTIIYRLEGEPAVKGENTFSDVENGTWYTNAVIWASENGIVNGYGNGKFGPSNEITREQMAKIMYNYAEFKGYDVSGRDNLKAFNDVDTVSSWAVEEMKWAVNAGLINGKGDGRLDPKSNAERCQAAAIFMRFCNIFVK